ncbi:MAG: polysaccharide biosynthesis tyrosine autokinase [Hyphomonadaceae bacterium]
MGYSDPKEPRGPRKLESTALATITDVEQLSPYASEPRTSTHSTGEGGGAEIWGLFRTLWRRKFLIVAIVAIGVGISAYLTMRITPAYRAAVSMEIQARELQIIRGAGVDQASSSDADFMGTQVALLNSRALAERVAKNLKLVDEPGYANPRASEDVRLDQASAGVLGGLSVSPMRGARVIEVAYVSPNPVEAARIANAVAENFIEMTLERRYSTTDYAQRFLEERIASTKTLLENTERQLVAYSKDQEILDLSGGAADVGKSLDASALVSLSGSLTAAQNARILSEQRYKEASTPGARDVLNSPALQTLRQTRSQFVADYQTKLSTLKPEHPEMVEIKARIAAIESEMENERSNIIKVREAEYRSAVAEEAALAKRVSELKEQVQGLQSRSIDYNILQREADTLRAQYDALLQRLKEVSITSGVGTSQVSILDRAEVPYAPFEPQLMSALVRAAALSLALALALALFVEFLDDRIKTPDDITNKLGARIIGVIPLVKSRKSILKLIRNPREPVSEAFSSTRAMLQFAIYAGSMKSFLVTGSKSSEGKTTTTLALASSFAAVGKRVLIIDGDLRRPSFSFDAKASSGLAGVLSRAAPLAQQIVPGPTPNLFLLPAGAVPPNPAELLSSNRLKRLMEEANGAFDLIFVDSPPVLSVADAAILSSVCDGTLLIVQSGGILRHSVRRSLDRLHAARAGVVGVILNKFDARKAGYGASYEYGYRGHDRGYLRLSAPSGSTRQVREFSEARPRTHDGVVE